MASSCPATHGRPKPGTRNASAVVIQTRPGPAARQLHQEALYERLAVELGGEADVRDLTNQFHAGTLSCPF